MNHINCLVDQVVKSDEYNGTLRCFLTPKQVRALKKIGWNRNYLPDGVCGSFDGVVQNMHMHEKYHETVQVCCDNFPKEKIKEIATMLARFLHHSSANSWQWDLHSSGSGNTLHWQWELILPVGTLSWQWECLVHFIPNTGHGIWIIQVLRSFF
nr:uncharacterized CRM domain-containing protein At3g25440, chloroplastic [Tanacetum cinerariifolium]